MLSLVTDILPNTPGVRAATSARRVSHLTLERDACSETPVRDAADCVDNAFSGYAFNNNAPEDGTAEPRVGREEPTILPISNLHVGHRGPTLRAGARSLQGWGMDSNPQKFDCDSPADCADDLAAWKPRNAKLAQLAEQIRQLRMRGHAPPVRCPSGLPELDAVLGGGFVTAAVHELVADRAGAAIYSITWRIAIRAASGSRWIFYIDTQHDLYPPGVAQLGVPLGRLVVVRTAHPADALWVCEQTLRCRAVAAVVLPLRTVDAQASRRLQLAAEAGGNLCLLLRGDERGGYTFAASRLRVNPLVGECGVRRLLVTVLKMREGRPREPFVVELPDAADSVPAHAVPADGAGTSRRYVGG